MRLAVAFNDSSAGHLKRARHADCVASASYVLAGWAMPLIDNDDVFFRERLAIHRRHPGTGSSSVEDCAEWDIDTYAKSSDKIDCADEVEIWADPDPDAQIKLIQSLSHLGRRGTDLAKTRIVHLGAVLAEQGPLFVERAAAGLSPVMPAQIELATRAWAAIRQPTPESVVALLSSDTSALPHLDRAFRLFLMSLPAPETGLTGPQREIVTGVGQGFARPDDLFREVFQRQVLHYFGHWETGKAIDELAAVGLLAGLEDGPFDMALHDNSDRYAKWRQSNLTLTPLGRAILAGDDDFARHATIHRWWGSTELTNDNLWRWDIPRQRLIAPS